MAEQEKETLEQQSSPDTEPEKVAEDIASEVEAEAETPDTPDELTRLREEHKELEDRHLRLMAEFGNFRNRTAKEKDNIYGDAVANTLCKFLPVLDNLERALESPCSDEEYKKGVALIHKGLWDTMTGLGVEEIAESGVDFDPGIHNAVMHVEDENLGKNTVAQVLQKGYRMGDRILRYAMVQAAN